ncbi:hypothetical protein [Allocoleopsis sp.]
MPEPNLMQRLAAVQVRDKKRVVTSQAQVQAKLSQPSSPVA